MDRSSVVCIVGAFACFLGAFGLSSAAPDPLLRRGVPTADYSIRGKFAASYDGRTRGPRWVLERLDAKTLKPGNADRKGDTFHAPMDIGKEFRSTPADYHKSGFDLGHMAPAADFPNDQAAMDSSFTTANSVPQPHDLNAGTWLKLESSVRDTARQPGVSVWIVTCPLFIPIDTKLGGMMHVGTIGPNHVWIPSHCGKAILVERDGEIEVSAWIIPNVKCDGDLSKHAVSVDQFESAAGLDVFSGLPDDQENRLEARKP